MKKMIINKLYIFSIKDKLAKVVEFKNGNNIITSDRNKGNKVGKSVILKSIYHTLGADCSFDDIWNINEKTYILDINIDDNKFYINRNGTFFKIFTKDFELIFKTVHREQLSEFLEKLYGFAVQLPSKDENKLEYAPPAFNYIINFLDQDGMRLTNFSSFKNLTQYSHFKENVLYYHFGIFNEEYYNIIKLIEELVDTQKEIEGKYEFTNNMLEKILEDINNFDYAKNMKTLNIQVENSKEEYSNIIEKLNNAKKSIIEYKNQRESLISKIRELNLFKSKNEKNIVSVEKHICPICHSDIENETEILINQYNTSEDFCILLNELDMTIIKVDERIVAEEEKYKVLLNLLNKYEEKININDKEINDILKYKGFIEVKENLTLELGDIFKEINSIKEKIKSLNKERRKYDVAKKQVNDKYKELMSIDKERFKLEEIEYNKIENIKNVFTASGSNVPIATIIWYFNLLKIKYIFNPDVIRFPIILDTPNNVELDTEKEQELFKYIFENTDENTQLIIATLGFKDRKCEIEKINNIIELDNEKYHLLNSSDYEINKAILLKITNTSY